MEATKRWAVYLRLLGKRFLDPLLLPGSERRGFLLSVSHDPENQVRVRDAL